MAGGFPAPAGPGGAPAFSLDPNSLAAIPQAPMMTSLTMPHRYVEVTGGDHGSLIPSAPAVAAALWVRYTR